jgi:hypothetical protein
MAKKFPRVSLVFSQKLRLANMIIIHSSLLLQPYVGPWPLLQCHNLFYTDGRTPWTSDQPVSRPRTEQHKRRINAYTVTHNLSGIRTHNSRVRTSEDNSWFRPRGHRDRQYDYHLNQFYIFTCYFFDIHFNIILQFAPRALQFYFRYRFFG